MKNLKFAAEMVLATIMLGLPLAGCSEAEKAVDAKPYPLDTCLVCGMELGEMGSPYVFVYRGQEIKVCAKSEQGEFNLDPDKYLKKLADAGTAPAK